LSSVAVRIAVELPHGGAEAGEGSARAIGRRRLGL
jgi:hypothetical protein